MTRRKEIQHGTYLGYQAHKRHQTEPCDQCRAANAANMRERRKQNPALIAWQTRTQEARRRALVRLAALHPSQFEALYAEEKEADRRRAVETLRNGGAS